MKNSKFECKIRAKSIQKSRKSAAKMRKSGSYVKVGIDDLTGSDDFFEKESCCQKLSDFILDAAYDVTEEDKEMRKFKRRCLPKLTVTF